MYQRRKHWEVKTFKKRGATILFHWFLSSWSGIRDLQYFHLTQSQVGPSYTTCNMMFLVFLIIHSYVSLSRQLQVVSHTKCVTTQCCNSGECVMDVSGWVEVIKNNCNIVLSDKWRNSNSAARFCRGSNSNILAKRSHCWKLQVTSHSSQLNKIEFSF